MPQRYIKIPEPVVLVDPKTREPLKEADGKHQESETLRSFIGRLMQNPMWSESYTNVKAAAAIEKAFDQAVTEKAPYAMLAEEDWKKLCAAAETPKQMIYTQMGPQVMPGYGFHPSVSMQLLPLLEAIMNASDKSPQEAEVKPEK